MAAMIVTEENPGADTLKEVGAELSGARAERGRTVAEVAASLRLVPAYIEAIERGDLSALPTVPYVVGYVRSYANLLGLDADELCGRLRSGLDRNHFYPEYNFVGDRTPRSGGAGRMAFAAMAAMMIGYGGWYAYDAGLIDSQDRPTPGTVVETALPALTDTAETALQADGADIPAEAGGELETAGTTVLEGLDAPVPDDGAADTAAAIDTGSEGGLDAPPLAAEIFPQVGQAVAHNRDPDTEMVIKALATSWVEISRPDGSIVNSWLMREGDEYAVPGDEDIYLTAGNAGGLEIEIAGRPPKKLGEWGETVNEMPLDPALLSDRY